MQTSDSKCPACKGQRTLPQTIFGKRVEVRCYRCKGTGQSECTSELTPAGGLPATTPEPALDGRRHARKQEAEPLRWSADVPNRAGLWWWSEIAAPVEVFRLATFLDGGVKTLGFGIYILPPGKYEECSVVGGLWAGPIERPPMPTVEAATAIPDPQVSGPLLSEPKAAIRD